MKLNQARLPPQGHDQKLADEHSGSVFNYLVALYCQNLGQTTSGAEIAGVMDRSAIKKVDRTKFSSRGLNALTHDHSLPSMDCSIVQVRELWLLAASRRLRHRTSKLRYLQPSTQRFADMTPVASGVALERRCSGFWQAVDGLRCWDFVSLLAVTCSFLCHTNQKDSPRR